MHRVKNGAPCTMWSVGLDFHVYLYTYFVWYTIKITISLSNPSDTKPPPSIVFLPHPLADTKPPPTILFLSHTAFSTALVLARRPTRVPISVAAGSPRWVWFFGILHFLNGGLYALIYWLFDSVGVYYALKCLMLMEYYVLCYNILDLWIHLLYF